MFFRQGDVRHKVPRLEFVCVNRFASVVLREARAEIVSGTDVGLLGVAYAAKDIHVEHPPSLTSSFGGQGTARLRLPD